ncbi:MAG: hypothetical protein IJW26_02490 [Clostridia bacterium]|nr:hypothetical protein [Clostridia bacterium]
MEKSNAKKIAFYGVMAGLMFVFLLIETFVFTAFFGNFTPAILTLPLAVALSLFNGKKGMWVGGTIFGCCSFFLAVCISNVIFLNPLVSILPRVFIGIVAYFVYYLVGNLLKNAKSEFVKEVLPCSIAGAFGILTNSVCTIFMMWVFNSAELAMVLSVIISINFVAEIVGSIILAPIYIRIFKRINGKL